MTQIDNKFPKNYYIKYPQKLIGEWNDSWLVIVVSLK